MDVLQIKWYLNYGNGIYFPIKQPNVLIHKLFGGDVAVAGRLKDSKTSPTCDSGSWLSRSTLGLQKPSLGFESKAKKFHGFARAPICPGLCQRRIPGTRAHLSVTRHQEAVRKKSNAGSTVAVFVT